MKKINIALVLVLFVVAATLAAQTQTTVFVPGNATGAFGNVDVVVPLVPALTVSGPGTIQVTYISGTVDLGGVITGPDGISFDTKCCQSPLGESRGEARVNEKKFGALIGVFVPSPRVNHSGFTAIVGTKNATPVGIMPGGLFFIGTGKAIEVTQAGTLFLGINDWGASNNTGGFTVEVTGP